MSGERETEDREEEEGERTEDAMLLANDRRRGHESKYMAASKS